MDEFEFIHSIKPRNYLQPSLIKGIGDDAAVFRQSYQDTVTAVDTFVEGVHFSRETMLPFHIGYRALAANISDMAAMGCVPAYYLISIVIPTGWSDEELREIYHGMNKIASDYRMDLIGGDTVSGEQLTISVTIIGFVDQGKARYRSDAKGKDIVFVTGTLGDSAAGFHLLTEEIAFTNDKDYFINRHRMPTPRVNFARALESISRVSLNDISDGIGNEAAEIAEASKVTVHLQYNDIPVQPSFLKFNDEQQRKWKLFGGEDFELIGTVSEYDWPVVLQAAEKTGTKVSKIGYVSEAVDDKPTVLLHEKHKKTVRLEKLGYTHLK